MYPFLMANVPFAILNTPMLLQNQVMFAILSHTPEAPEGPSVAADPSWLCWWTVVSHTSQVGDL